MGQSQKKVCGLFIEELEVRAAPAPVPNINAYLHANGHARFMQMGPIYTTMALGEESGSGDPIGTVNYEIDSPNMTAG